jgi:hypothetical protein
MTTIQERWAATPNDVRANILLNLVAISYLSPYIPVSYWSNDFSALPKSLQNTIRLFYSVNVDVNADDINTIDMLN